MVDVFNIIFQLFNMTITSFKKIPLTENVSLYDFSIAILILSIVVVAFVPIVKVGSTDYVNDTLRSERAQQAEIQREEERQFNNSYENYRNNRIRKENYNKRYNFEFGRGKKK